MSRTINASNLTQTQATTLIPAFFLDLEFTGGYLRFWSGVGDFAWGGNTYLGAGHVLSITNIMETAEIKAAGISMTLTGVPASIISTVLSESRQGKTVKIYLGFLNSSRALVATPETVFDGRLDVPTIELSGDSATVSITAESRLIDLERIKAGRFTDKDQQARYSGDKGLEYIESLQTKRVIWGKQQVGGGGGGGGKGGGGK